jgi:hypothetical protein
MMKNVLFVLSLLAFAALPCAALADQNLKAHIEVTNLPGGGGQGMCSARFGFNIGLGGVDVSDVTLQFDFYSDKGTKLYSSSQSISLDGSEGGHYKELMIESEELCDAVSRVTISSAIGTVNKKRVDLLKEKMISVGKFVPLSIVVSEK